MLSLSFSASKMDIFMFPTIYLSIGSNLRLEELTRLRVLWKPRTTFLFLISNPFSLG